MEIPLLGSTPLSFLAGLPGILSILFVFVSLWMLLDVPSGRHTIMLASSVAVWAFGYAFTLNAGSQTDALFWAKVSTSALILFPALCYLFNSSFVRPEGVSRRRMLSLLLLAASFEIAHWSGPSFIMDIERHSWGYFPTYRLPFLAFLATFVATFYLILRDSWRHYRASAGPTRSRDLILLVAWVLCSCGGADLLIGFGVPLVPLSFVPVTFFILMVFLLLLRYGTLGFLQHWSLNSIFQSTADSMLLINRDGTLRRVDGQTAAILGCTDANELEGRSVNALFSPDTPLFRPDDLDRLPLPPNPEPLHLELRPRSGEPIPMRVRLSGVQNKKGELLGMLAIGRDIRDEIEKNEKLKKVNFALMEKVAEVEERKGALARANRELEESRAAILEILQDMEESHRKLGEAYQRLAEIDQTKDAFLSSVSHELRTPLSSIRSFSELLLQYPDENEETRREFIGIIHQESERLTRLVNDLLDLSKIESGKQHWRDEKVDIRAVLAAAQQNLSVLALEKNLSVQVDAGEHLPALFADRDRIYQVVSNLYTNAVKFTPQGGSIRLSASLTAGAGPGGAATMLLVRVCDTGCGIPEKDLLRIFEKFQQGGDGLRDKPRGTGLGLAICREIVQHYGGRIWAENNPGGGCCFFFTLPLPAVPYQTKDRGEKPQAENLSPEPFVFDL
ncbi:MAG: ATP-binding protein [bacterium]